MAPLLATLLVALTTLPALATEAPDERPALTLRNPEPRGATESIFGYAVAGTATTVVVAAPHASVDGRARAGAVYVFDARTGALLRTLRDPARRADDLFGFAVAEAGDLVVVAAPRTALYGLPMAGVVYAFEAQSGRLLRVFTDPRPNAGAEFGSALAFSGGDLVIGSPATSLGAEHAGCARLFDVRTGKLRRTFRRPMPVAGEVFAQAVAAAGAGVLIGAPEARVGGLARAGAVYLFARADGVLLHAFEEPTPAAENLFGSALAGTDALIAIGAPHRTDGQAADAGAVYLFDARSGALLRTLTEPVADRADRLFGYALATACGGLLVGAPHARVGDQAHAGIAYLFDAETGALVRTFREPAPAAGAELGLALAAADGRVVVGAQRARGVTSDGAAHLFECGHGS